MTKIYDWEKNVVESELNECTESIKKGKIAVFPTETVYGIGANAYCEDSVKEIYNIKQRPEEKPLTILVGSIKDIGKYAYISNDIEKNIINRFMPGPITIILKKRQGIFDYVSSGKDTIGIRIPDSPIILKILEKVKVPMVAPSANISGKPSGICFEDVLKDFNGKVDVCINGGKSKISRASTIVQVVNGKPVILREGIIPLEEIEKIAYCGKNLQSEDILTSDMQ